MADESPHFTLSTHESIVIDGANSVGGAPRQHFPDATLSLALGAVVALTLVLRSDVAAALIGVAVVAVLRWLGL